LFAESEPGASAEARCRALRAAVDQLQGAWEFPEAGHLQHQFAARISRSMAVTRRTRLRRWSQACNWAHCAAHFDHEIFRGNREPLLTRLAQHGILAGFEEALDGAKDFGPEGF
jgi:hypothetical protein